MTLPMPYARLTRALSLVALWPVIAAAQAPQAPEPGPTPLSFTEEQAARGQAIAAATCATCHSATLQGGPGGPPMVGAAFRARWTPQSGDALFNFIREKMPPANPGSLSTTDYADVFAYVLKTNGAKAGTAALSADPAKLAPLSLAAALPPLQGPPSVPRVRPSVAPLPLDEIATEVLKQRTALLQQVRPVTEGMLRNPPVSDWISWRGTYNAHGFSRQAQINRQNVDRLQPAWTRQLAPGPNEITPLVHDGVLYVASSGRVEALDAATGDQLWQYVRPGRNGIARNIAISGELVYYAAATSIVALDMRTGKVVWDHLVAAADAGTTFSSGPFIAKGKVFQGLSGCSSPYPGGCFLLALDALTGKELWRFNTIARPGQPGGDTWNGVPIDERYGGSIWLPGSYDPDLDLLYFGTGQTYKTATLINGRGVNDRAAGLYTDSTLAFRPDTGELVWYYQHLNGDIWDQDWAFERVLTPLKIGGQTRRTVTTGGKLGIFDTLDAATGQYLSSFDIGVQTLVKSIDPKTGAKTIDPKFAPEANVEKLICTGSVGGRDWPATAFNPATNILYVPFNDACMRFTWNPGAPFDVVSERARGSTDGMVGRIQAIDLTSRKTLWTRRERAGHSSAILATAGGLIFEGARDQWFRASDDRTGKVLWRIRLDMPPSSYPITYAVEGQQYVAVTSGGGNAVDSGMGPLTPELTPATGGITLWVFKLPDGKSRK
jgi:alcohol dehydrogenase (cytochrome c)